MLLLHSYLHQVPLQYKAGLSPGSTVLVTAAAGGTGHFAVQIAKLKGCHTIATCGTQEKVEKLKAIGADRVINYKEEVRDSDNISLICLQCDSTSRN